MIAAILLAAALAQEGKLVETIEVRVANVDVVVRDRAGNPVTGLTKDDFELFENGVRQPITNLYEVRRATAADQTAADNTNAAPIEVSRRRLLLFVDSASMQPARKKILLASAEKFIARMQPEDEAMIVAWKPGLQVVTPFTSDKAKLQLGLAEVERFAPAGESPQIQVTQLKRKIQDLIFTAQTSGSRPLLTMAEARKESLQEVSFYADRLIAEQGRMLEALNRMAANFAGVDGKKVLLFVGENLPERPGAELYRYVYDQFEPLMSRNDNPLDLQVTSGQMGNNRLQQIEDFANTASVDGVTIYAIDAGQIDSDLSAAERDLQVDYGESFSRNANTAGSLKTMAEMTGGVAITQTTNFDLAFDTISRDLDSYYSLGYKPVGEGNIQARKIVVKTKNKAYTVRSREALTVKSNDDQMADKVISNLYTDAASSAWPITVRTGRPRQDGRHFVVPVEVVMPSTITLLPQDKDLVGQFTLYFVVGTADGHTSEVMRSPHDLRLPATGEALMRAKPMTFTTALRLNPGESTLSVAAVDRLSGTTGYTRTTIVAH
jgi:VWFA-related protein